ncbi:hypothetical protein H2278_07775, partial [Campylobacter sp. W0018]|uniref:hypothetical protein n=1 Tax=Campylobacter sp. W0018 TaxID=2735782 RepID=UPI00301D7F28|nr:hypothetical protein [Campylobacter sp. W0018]
LSIPKGNKIKFALTKIQASPLAKIKYDRIKWQGIGDKPKSAQRRKEKAKMLLYLENENKRNKVNDKEVHLYKHNVKYGQKILQNLEVLIIFLKMVNLNILIMMAIKSHPNQEKSL